VEELRQDAVITLDTSALVALFNRADPHHERVSAVLESDSGPYFVPAGILAEITCMLEQRQGAKMLDAFLADLETGAFTLDCGERNIARIRALVERYSDLPLGFSDASVIACAEERGGRVATVDRRHFDVVSRDASISVYP
jgi:predicted nucleic acid-binding protein